MGDNRRKVRVAVFPYRGKRGYRFNAYTRIYNPEWEGCNLVDVEAANGNEAKKLAVDIIRTRLTLGTDDERASVRVAGG